MSIRIHQNVVYGLTEALTNVPLLPIVANRAPTTRDMAALGTIWIFKPQNIAYVLTSVVNNEATWVNITQAPGDFVRYEVQTMNAVATPIATFAMAPSSAINIWANVAATESDYTGAGAWISQATYHRDALGGPVLTAYTPLIANEDFGGGDPEINFVIVGNTVEIQVTGIAGTVINWAADVTTIIL